MKNKIKLLTSIATLFIATNISAGEMVLSLTTGGGSIDPTGGSVGGTLKDSEPDALVLTNTTQGGHIASTNLGSLYFSGRKLVTDAICKVSFRSDNADGAQFRLTKISGDGSADNINYSLTANYSINGITGNNGFSFTNTNLLSVDAPINETGSIIEANTSTGATAIDPGTYYCDININQLNFYAATTVGINGEYEDILTYTMTFDGV